MMSRQSKIVRPWVRAAVASAALVNGSAALAQGVQDDSSAAEPAASAQRTADSGALSTWSMAPRTDTQRAFVHVQGGYDAAKKGAAMESLIEARIYGRFALRAGASYVGPEGKVRPLVAAKVDTLRQERHGIDMAIAAGYEPHGFNTVPALGVLASLGRSFGATTLLANVGYGLGLDEGEHYGDARLAALVRVARSLRVGLDSRFRMDLERDSDEPEGEPDWELVAGPLATVTFGRFVVSGGAGLSAIRMRLQPDTNVGVLAHMGVGAVF